MPKMTVGKYIGTPIDQLPMSYLRWMMTQDFPKEWLDIADRKLKASAQTSNLGLEVSRHAIDQFSLRFLDMWLSKPPEGMGLGTFIVKTAQEAWIAGQDRSKRRHQNEGVIKEWKGIKWVFGYNPAYPDYKDLITVMAAE